MTLFQRILRAIWKPIAPIPRTDKLLVGYYGADDAQVAETADHVSVHWDIGIGGQEAMIARLMAAKLPAVIELRGEMFAQGPDRYALRPDAEQRLLALRDALSAAGVLRNIIAVAPIDEPDISTSPEDQRAANRIARRVFDCPLAVIYAGVSRLTCIEDYGLVGFDDYPERERVFDVTLRPWPPRSDYDRLISRLRPDQRVILLPGGGDPWRQDPGAFMRQAQDGRVAMVLGFLWIDRADCDPPAVGIRGNGMAEAYRQAFQAW